ncbi:MAG TPA: PLP-dependent aminotransferase family protein [Steroidobacteraceae bacterium]|jgi:DNA-binding transcriptional MocR family regulator|nr:PLP-dependent aminotransferase family protein [Steroidobacteraceae bacterium]
MSLEPKQDHRLPAQLAARFAQRIENHALRPGTRLPSIRSCAQESRVSRSTVVEAYDRLIAAGLIESRRGSGFYVRLRSNKLAQRRSTAHPMPASALDVSWLLRAQRRQSPGSEQPGAGLLPENWLDHELVAAAVRGVGRSRGSWLLKYGTAEGYLPLREALSTRLAHVGIEALPEQIITTAGATAAIDLVARRFLVPGDVVFVEDPAWFVMFARFAAFGARIVGVPRTADGPDIAALESLLTREKPKLFILNSVAHNPTGSCISPVNAVRVLELAIRHNFMIVEDDIYGDLQGRHATRLASLDALRHVVYVGGFSKTLAANLRVGYMAAHPALIRELRDIKALTGLASSELSERVVARIIVDRAYERMLERVRARLDDCRARTAEALVKMGAKIAGTPVGGMYLWADFGRDTNELATAGSREGVLLAPGSLFSPTQLPTTWMRVAAATCLNPVAMKFLARATASR